MFSDDEESTSIEDFRDEVPTRKVQPIEREWYEVNGREFYADTGEQRDHKGCSQGCKWGRYGNLTDCCVGCRRKRVRKKYRAHYRALFKLSPALGQ